jgi:hypothetical protein
VSGELYQPSLIFVGKAGAWPLLRYLNGQEEKKSFFNVVTWQKTALSFRERS